MVTSFISESIINFNSLSYGTITLYFIIGVIGATIANTTGAGGGVIFIPFFAFIGLPNVSAVATSIGIQCFGMTAGSISWLRNHPENRLKNICYALFCSLVALIGMYIAMLLENTKFNQLNLLFGLLSISVAIAYFYLMNSKKSNLNAINSNIKLKPIIFLASFIGGIFTYYISIGVGELVLIACIASGASLLKSISFAVLTTSLTVIPSLFLFSFNNYIIPEILLPVGAGAIIGGIFASKIVNIVGAKTVKSFCLIIISLTGIIEISIWGHTFN